MDIKLGTVAGALFVLGIVGYMFVTAGNSVSGVGLPSVGNSLTGYGNNLLTILVLLVIIIVAVFVLKARG